MPGPTSKAAALSVIASIVAKDVDKFDQAFKSVDDEAVEFLEKFLVEAITGQHETFIKQDSPELYDNASFARAVLQAWKRVGNARGKMGARMAFEAAIESIRRTK